MRQDSWASQLSKSTQAIQVKQVKSSKSSHSRHLGQVMLDRDTAPRNTVRQVFREEATWGYKTLHGANTKLQLTISICLNPQASNLLRLPVFFKPHASHVKKPLSFELNLTSWTCCQRRKTDDCQPLPFSTSFKLTAPASVFEATRILGEKTYFDVWLKSYIIDINKTSK